MDLEKQIRESDSNQNPVDYSKESIEERVVDLLNQAIISVKESEKTTNLQKCQELVIHHDILDNFLDEVIGFQNDRFVEVRKFVVGFIEAACKKDAEYNTKLIINLNALLNDSNANVVKRTIQAATQLYKYFVKWVSKSKITEIIESTWEVWQQIKTTILNMLDTTDNEGIRTQCIKFMEVVVVIQSKRDQWSFGDEMSLDSLAQNKVINISQLEEESKQLFEQLLIYHGTPHISSVNLMTTMQTLVYIARQRSYLFMAKVIQALEALHANLPPTLATSQVNSVRKHLKLHLMLLLKHPVAASSSQMQTQIVQLLNDLGAGQSEVNKCLQEVRKRGIQVDNPVIEPKRIKLEPEEEGAEKHVHIAPPKITKADANTAIDITAEDLVAKLSVDNVSDLVLVAMLALPDTMPAHFQAAYAPVTGAGTPSQIKNLSRLLATQFTANGLGKGVDEMVSRTMASIVTKKMEVEDKQHLQKIATVISRAIAQEVKKQEQSSHNQQHQQPKVRLMPTGKPLSGSLKCKQLNLSEVTKELNDESKCKMILNSVYRILDQEDKHNLFSSQQLEKRSTILAHLATNFNDSTPNIQSLIRGYILDDIKNRIDVAFNLLYNEFLEGKKNSNNLALYDKCLTSLIRDLIEKCDFKDRDHFLPRFYMECPVVTEDAIKLLATFIKSDIINSNTVSVGLGILKSLIESKIALRPTLLEVLLDLCIAVDKSEVRSQAIKVAKYLHEIYGTDVKESIEKFALRMLRYLLEPKAPEIFGTSDLAWNEENIKVCLMLYLSLLPNNHKLIHDLAKIYVITLADIKRVILRVVEGPVRGIGMNSPELLLLVENCPKGAETLITRIIHVLTDKHHPSAELVSRVRDLYYKRVPDVRFLIPVLNGLSKKEVIGVLPDLIKLNPIVVKEVFNKKLLNPHAESGPNYQSPLTPAELLIALHNIDSSKCDMKTIIKATSLCFVEKNIYTAEVLAVVMQLLMEQNPLPTLLMRTVIQSLSLYPRLIGFVMNILQRLILKQVWKQKKVWEGFIKCCQRTKPQSFQVLLQLPATQLQTVFSASPDLKPALQQHVRSFTDHQRSHVPQSILEVIFSGDTQTEQENLNQSEDIQMKQEKMEDFVTGSDVIIKQESS